MIILHILFWITVARHASFILLWSQAVRMGMARCSSGTGIRSLPQTCTMEKFMDFWYHERQWKYQNIMIYLWKNQDVPWKNHGYDWYDQEIYGYDHGKWEASPKTMGSCRNSTINNGNLSMKKIPELEAKLCGWNHLVFHPRKTCFPVNFL